MWTILTQKNSEGAAFFSTIFVSAFLISSISFAVGNEAPQAFTYQGKFMNGASPMTGTYDLKFEIYAPGGACLLYQEIDQNNNLTTTGGNVAIPIGTLPGVNYVPGVSNGRGPNDQGLTMATIFQNTTVILAPGAPNCGAGYIPSAGDIRLLRVYYGTNPAYTQMTTDQSMYSSPHAIVAQTLEGIGSTGFIQVTGTVTQTAVTNLLTAAFDASAAGYHNHDSRYALLGGSTTQNFSTQNEDVTGQLKVGAPGFTAGVNLDIEEATPPVLRIGSTGNSGDQMSLQFYAGNGTTNTASITSMDNSNTLSISTGGVNAITVNPNQTVTFSNSVSASALALSAYLSLGRYATGSEPVAVPEGTMWENSTTHYIRFFDGTSNQTLAQLNDVVNNVTSTGNGIVVGGTATAPTLALTYGTAANTALQGNQTFAGDVTGTSQTTNVAKLQTYTVDMSTPPTNNQVLTYVTPANKWVPANASSGVPTLTLGSVVFSGGGTTLSQDNTMFFWDDTNHRLGLNAGTTPGNRLSVNTPSTADANAQVMVSNTAITNKALVLQEFTGQNTNMVEVQDHTGAKLYTVEWTGTPTATTDLTTKSYVDATASTAGGLYVKKDGTTAMTGDWNVGGTNAFYNMTKLGVGETALSGNAQRFEVPWLAGDALSTSYFGSANVANNQVAMTAVSYSGFGAYGYSVTSDGVRGISGSGIGVHGISTSSNSGLFQSAAAGNTASTLVTQQFAGQANETDLFEAQNSAGTPMVRIDSVGNFGFVNVTSDPAGLVAGDKGKMWFRSDTNQLKYWDGAAPQVVSSGGGTPPGGATTQVQFNNAGAFAGDADFVWSTANHSMTLNTSNAPTGDAFVIARNPTASATKSLIRVGGADIVSGNTHGTFIGANSTAGFQQDLLRLENDNNPGFGVVGNSTGGTDLVQNVLTQTVGADATLQATSGSYNMHIQNSGASADWGFSSNTNFTVQDWTNNKTPMTFESSAPNNSLYVKANGSVALGNANPGAQLEVDSAANGTIGQIIKAKAAPTVDIFDIDNSAGAPQVYVDSSFILHGNGAGLSGVSASAPGAGGDVPFNNGSNVFAADTGKFFWDSTNHRLGIGTNAPSFALDVKSAAGNGVLIETSGANTQPFMELQNPAHNYTMQVDGTDANKLKVMDGGTAGTARMAIDTSGNVGIGTTSPGAKLQIYPNANSTVGLIVQGDNNQSSAIQQWQNSSGTPLAAIGSDGSFSATNGVGNNYADNTNYTSSSITSSAPGGAWYNELVNVNGQSALNKVSMLVLDTRNGTSENQAYFGAVTNSSYSPTIVIGQTTGASSYQERMRIDQNGNVGIGSTNPGAQLEVDSSAAGTVPVIVRQPASPTVDMQDWYGNGTLFYSLNNSGTPSAATDLVTKNYVTTAITAANGNYVATAGTTPLTGNWNVGNFAMSNVSTLSVGTATAPTGGVATFNGNVGIATTTPGYPLDVNGSIRTNAALILNGADIDFSNGIGAANIYGGSGPNYIAIKTSGSDRLHVDTNGLIGINQAVPTAQLENDVGADTTIGAIVKAHSGTTSADLWEIQDQTGLKKVYVDSSYVLHGNGSALTGVSAAAPGANKQIPFNNGSNVFAASATSTDFTIDDTNHMMTLSSTAPTTDGLVVPTMPHATSTTSLLRLGPADVTSGDTHGTFVGANTSGAFLGLFLDFENNGTAEFKVNQDGRLTMPNAPPTVNTDAYIRMGPVLNAGSGSGTYIGANPASAVADFVNYQVGGTTKFWVSPDGSTAIHNGSASAHTFSVGTPVVDQANVSTMITAGSATSTALVLETQATPTADVMDVVDSTGTKQVWIDSSFKLHGDGSLLTGVGGGGTAAGATGQIQFNNGSNAFAANANLFWDNTNSRLGVGPVAPSQNVDVSSANAPDVLIETTAASTLGPILELKNAAAGGHDYKIISDGSANGPAAGQLEFFDNGLNKTRMIINSTGLVGIGGSGANGFQNTPGGQLEVDASTAGTVPVVVRQPASPTVDMADWYSSGGLIYSLNNSGTPIAATDLVNVAYTGFATTASGALYLKKDGSVALTSAWNAGAQAIDNVSLLSVGTATAPSTGVATFNGDVGIGTTAPGTGAPGNMLDVTTPTTAADLVIARFSGNPGTGNEMIFELNNTQGAGNLSSVIDFDSNGTGQWVLGNDANNNGGQNFFLCSIANANRLYVTGGTGANAGDVGIGNTSPTSLLTVGSAGAHGNVQVNGQIYSPVGACTSATVCDFNSGNVETLTNTAGGLQGITLNNIQNGGSYSIVIGGTSTPATTFSFASSQCTSFVYSPSNAPTTANLPTVYTMLAAGSTCYVSWISGFQ